MMHPIALTTFMFHSVFFFKDIYFTKHFSPFQANFMQPDLTAGDRAQINKSHTSQQGVTTTSTIIPRIHNTTAYMHSAHTHTITKKKCKLLRTTWLYTNHLASNYYFIISNRN